MALQDLVVGFLNKKKNELQNTQSQLGQVIQNVLKPQNNPFNPVSVVNNAFQKPIQSLTQKITPTITNAFSRQPGAWGQYDPGSFYGQLSQPGGYLDAVKKQASVGYQNLPQEDRDKMTEASINFAGLTGDVKSKGFKSTMNLLKGTKAQDIVERVKTSIDEFSEVPNEYQKLNVNKMKLDPEQKLHVRSLETNEPRLVLKNADVIKMSDLTQASKSPVALESTKRKVAQELNSRQRVVSLENEFMQLKNSGARPEDLQFKIEEIAKQSKIARTEGTEAGRTLQARNILADSLATPMQKVFRLLDNAGVEEGKYLKDAATVDWSNAEQVVNFYRRYVKAKPSEWLDVIRYNSMLSSPTTSIVNAATGGINTTVVPVIEKAVTGVVDFLGSKIANRPQERFVGESAAYVKGYVQNTRKAYEVFRDTLKGKNMFKNLDLDYMPLSTEGKAGRLMKSYTLPTRALEAVDQFFTTLTEGGERAAMSLRQGKGVKVADPETLIRRKAAYRVFRGELKAADQGTVLNAIDELTGLIMRARSNDNPLLSTVAKFTLPFVKTPTNILKQGIEYSPVGFTTVLGSKNKSEQLAKAAIGTASMAATAMLAASGRTTWSEPTDSKKKQAFRDAGLQPYSVKIGDKWVSITKLPPAVGFPIALVAALHDAQENKTIDQNSVDVILSTVAKSGKFYADQSYLKSIGDLVAGIQGDPERRLGTVASNYTQQLIPWRAFFGWTTRILDPYQRKVDYNENFLVQQTQQLMKDLPFTFENVPVRENEYGEPIANQNRVFNAFSPVRVTNEDPEKKEYYDMLKQKSLTTKNLNIVKELVKEGKEVPPGAFDVGAAESEIVKRDYLREAQEEVLKARLERSGGTSETDDKFFYVDPETGKVKEVLKNRRVEMPKLSGLKELDTEKIKDYQSEITSKINDVVKLERFGAIASEEADRRIKELEAMRSGIKSKSGGSKKKGSLKFDFRKLAKSSTSTVKFKSPRIKRGRASRPKRYKTSIKEFRYKGKPFTLKV